MRYVVKNLADRKFHMADFPHTRSYCAQLRGQLEVVDPERASEQIADRTATVCGACRTKLADRRAAARSMEASFMITKTEKPTPARPAAEPGLFDLADAAADAPVTDMPAADAAVEVPAAEAVEVLPVVDAAAVIAAGVPVTGVPAADMVDIEATAAAGEAAARTPTEIPELSSARQEGEGLSAAVDVPPADIVIRHTHEDGTTVEGSAKGDGVWEALRPLSWTYRRAPGIHIRGSRYKGADRWKIDRAADAVRALGLSCAVVIEENMSFADREAARVDAAEERAERFTDRAGRASAESDRLWDAHNSIGERFFMGQPILIGHHSEGRARRDQERMWSMARKSVSEQRRAGYWANRAAASEAYERYRKNPGRTLRRIEKLEADRRGVLRERDGVDDKGRKADVWRREPSEERREDLTRRLAEYDEELTYWAETIKEAERRGFKVWGKPDFVRGDFALWRGTWYEVTRVNAKSVTVPHIHAEFDGGAVGAVGGCRVVTRAATEESRHKGSTYTLPYDGVSGRMSADQMRAALAGEAISADPRDAIPEPAPEETEAHAAACALPDVVSDPSGVDVWEGEGGAVPGVDTPCGPGAGPAAAEFGPLADPKASTTPETIYSPQGAPAPGLASPRVAELAGLAPDAALTLF